MAKQQHNSEGGVFKRPVARSKTTEEGAIEEEDAHDNANWFSLMVSRPLRKNMSTVDIFTQWSAVVAYIIGGVQSMCIPTALAKPLNIQGQYTDGLTRASGMQLAIIGFLYCIFARAKSRISSDCIALGTTVERILYIGSSLFALHRLQLVPWVLPMAIGVLDWSLSIITLGIWFSTNNTASVKNYFASIAQLISFSSKKNFSSYPVQVIGWMQLCTAAVAILFFPDKAMELLQVNTLGPHDKGLVFLVVIASGAIGFIHLSNGSADCKAFNIAVVFYSVCFSIPFVVALSVLNQIPIGVSAYMLCIDGMYAVGTCLALCIDKH